MDTPLTDQQRNQLRSLPAVDALARDADPARTFDPSFVAVRAREALATARSAILQGQLIQGSLLVEQLATDLASLLQAYPTPVINGTGVIVQTNLGRAPVSRAAAAAMADAAGSYLALEMQMESGARGGRASAVEQLLCMLTGAEAALIVNNNAAAILLVLTALTREREVLVSRGEAVEIGGGFRVPDVLRASGARLVDVGTTNRTYAADYANALTPATAAILRVHASNYVVEGFTHRASLAELRAVADQGQVTLIEDVGSGCLVDTSQFGLQREPTLPESIAADVDVVTASGDKLLGGPQAGIILGRRVVVEQLRRHPMARAMRADKTCLAGLHATMLHYAQGVALQEVPVWWSVSRTPDQLHARAADWQAALHDRVQVIESRAAIGGGSLPTQTLASFALAMPSSHPQQLARRLRLASQPVVPRVEDGVVVIDARTVLRDEDDALLATLRDVLAVEG